MLFTQCSTLGNTAIVVVVGHTYVHKHYMCVVCVFLCARFSKSVYQTMLEKKGRYGVLSSLTVEHKCEEV